MVRVYLFSIWFLSVGLPEGAFSAVAPAPLVEIPAVVSLVNEEIRQDLSMIEFKAQYLIEMTNRKSIADSTELICFELGRLSQVQDSFERRLWRDGSRYRERVETQSVRLVNRLKVTMRFCHADLYRFEEGEIPSERVGDRKALRQTLEKVAVGARKIAEVMDEMDRDRESQERIQKNRKSKPRG